jgi:cytochrome c-type biogenesis protein CcmH
MSTFLILAALLSLLSLSFILPALLGKPREDAPAPRDDVNLAVLRDQLRELELDLASGLIGAGAGDAARQELLRRVAEEVRPQTPAMPAGAGLRGQAAALGLALVLGAGGLYGLLGNPRGLDPDIVAAAPQRSTLSNQQAAAMVEQLARRMQDEPANAQGWLLLARSYTALQRHADAARAYARLLALVPDDAALLTSYADVLAVAQGKSLKGEPERLLRRALALDPNHVNALILFGSASFERADYAAAIASWERIAPLVEADSDTWRMTSANLADARARLPTQAK